MNIQQLAGIGYFCIYAKIPKVEDETIQHIGPMAQDFYAAFGLGDSETAIGTLDADGVSLAAIQALYQRSQDLEAENASLRQQMDESEERLAALESAIKEGAGSSTPLSGYLPAGAFLLVGLVWVGIRRGIIAKPQDLLDGGRR